MQGRLIPLVTLCALAACSDTNPAGAAADGLALTKIAGDGQRGTVGTRLAEPVSVLLERTDEAGVVGPAAGVVVRFVVTEGGGTVGAGTAVTDQDGLAQDSWTLGPEPGVNELEARAATRDGGSQVATVFTAYGEAPPLPFVDAAPLAAGQSHSCALDSGGTAYCWGRGASGQLGDGGNANRSIPGRVAGTVVFVSIVAGVDHTCGLSVLGAAYCWGRNDAGQLGDGTVVHRNVPTSVDSAPAFVSMAAGDHHTCALTPLGAAYCWGQNDGGQLGDGTTTQRSVPVEVVGGIAFTTISAGDAHTCGLDAAGTAYCWGLNGFGQLGDGTRRQRGVPTPMAEPRAFQATVGGAWHGCGLDASGTAYCWGDNSAGQLGDGTSTGRSAPARVAGLRRFSSLASRSLRTCGIDEESGEAYCWGQNTHGQLGDGTTLNRYVPTAVRGGGRFGALETGTSHGCGIALTGEVFCWGENDYGQLGDGTVARRLVPTRTLNWPPSRY